MPPAPLPVLPGVYYARIQGLADGKQVDNIFAFKKNGLVLNDPTDPLNAAAVGSNVAGFWNAAATAVLHTSYAGNTVATYALGTPLLPAVITATTATGGRGSTIHYKQLAYRCVLQTPRRGRGSQHGIFFSPMSDNDIQASGEQVSSTYRLSAETAVRAFVANVISALVSVPGGTWTHVQVSKFQNKVYTPNSFPVLQINGQLNLSSQRRRLGRG